MPNVSINFQKLIVSKSYGVNLLQVYVKIYLQRLYNLSTLSIDSKETYNLHTCVLSSVSLNLRLRSFLRRNIIPRYVSNTPSSIFLIDSINSLSSISIIKDDITSFLQAWFSIPFSSTASPRCIWITSLSKYLSGTRKPFQLVLSYLNNN